MECGKLFGYIVALTLNGLCAGYGLTFVLENDETCSGLLHITYLVVACYFTNIVGLLLQCIADGDEKNGCLKLGNLGLLVVFFWGIVIMVNATEECKDKYTKEIVLYVTIILYATWSCAGGACFFGTLGMFCSSMSDTCVKNKSVETKEITENDLANEQV